jgi:hypothetical protein
MFPEVRSGELRRYPDFCLRGGSHDAGEITVRRSLPMKRNYFCFTNPSRCSLEALAQTFFSMRDNNLARVATSIVSHIVIRFEGFIVLRLLSPGTWWTRAAQVEVM